MVIISVEGNIGAGKSTILSKLAKRPGVVVLQEDLDTWTNINGSGVNLFEAYMYNKEKYAFTFQMFNMTSTFARIELVLQQDPNTIIVMERSVLSGSLMFARTQYEAGYIDEVNWQTYLNVLYNSPKYFPNIICVLDVDVYTCYERMRERNRKGEEIVTMDYMCLLDKGLQSLMNTYHHTVITRVEDLEEIIDAEQKTLTGQV